MGFNIALCLLTVVSIVTSAPTDVELASNCLNPNHSVGKCISIYDCKSLIFVLRNQLMTQYRFVRLSQCNGGAGASGKFPFVCCTNDTDFRDSSADWQQRVIFPDDGENGRPARGRQKVALIEPPYCGALTISNKIYGGEEAGFTEFSWMVKLEYQTANGSLVSECAGSLINERYILTAAHCVTGSVEQQVGKLVSLLIGEHDFESPEDCYQHKCSPNRQRRGIESIIVHDRYGADRDLHINEHNDIALIRMDKSVDFNDQLQPVCLPTVNLQNELKEGTLLTAAGWGHTGLTKHSKVKKKVRLPLYALEKCRKIFERLLYVADEQLCAGGVYNEDACSGDSGGPLMRLNSTSWIIEGIVAFGRHCGQENQPGVYTRVRSYIDWIAEHLEPW